MQLQSAQRPGGQKQQQSLHIMCMDANLLHSQAKIASTVTIMPQEQTYYRKCRNCGPEYHMKFSKNEKISSLSGLFGIPSKSSIVVVVDYSPWSLLCPRLSENRDPSDVVAGAQRGARCSTF